MISRLTLIAVAATLLAAPVADAKPVLSANRTTLPKQYKAGGSFDCATLQIRDNNFDGIIEYRFTWDSPSWNQGHFQSKAQWDGTKLVADKPIPLIASLAVYGARYDLKLQPKPYIGDHLRLPDSFDRTICSDDSWKLNRPVTVAPLGLPRAKLAYQTRKQRLSFPLDQAGWTLADHQEAAGAILTSKNFWDAWRASEYARLEQIRQDELAAIQAAIDAANNAACPPGTLIGGKPCNPVDM